MGKSTPSEVSSGSYIPPSVHREETLAGESYKHFSPVPPSLLPSKDSDGKDGPTPEPCVLGVDEAGRGPVLGPMVYGVFYLPISQSTPILKETHHFDDSKVLTAAVRSQLMRAICTPPASISAESSAEEDAAPALNTHCGYAIASLSAQDISAGMLRPADRIAYNLNAQAMDATVDLIQGVLDRGVPVAEVYVDTVGPPATYQARLERRFPGLKITVAKKADSLYPCVSAASVCAKVTRDAALEVLYEARKAAEKKKRKRDAAAVASKTDNKKLKSSEDEADEAGYEQQQDTADENGEEKKGDAKEDEEEEEEQEETGMAWGSGYPSDGRCVTWLRRNMHPVFGWGPECRFSWGTARDMIEAKSGAGVRVEWPEDDGNGDGGRLTDFFSDSNGQEPEPGSELGNWFGTPAGLEAF